MTAIKIDPSLCIGCGECAADCVSRNIAVEDGRARVLGTACIGCGHCYAVCPAGAVSMPDYDCSGLEETVSLTEFNPRRLLLAMESRRSARRFTPEPVSDEALRCILDAGRCCPTGSNMQGVRFTVIRDKLDECEREAAAAFSAAGEKYARLVENGCGGGGHFFFKGAPLVILVSGRRETDPALASSYMELEAGALGLGALYSGFFVMAVRRSERLRSLLSLPAGIEPVTALCIGHSGVKYYRRVPRNAAAVDYV